MAVKVLSKTMGSTKLSSEKSEYPKPTALQAIRLLGLSWLVSIHTNHLLFYQSSSQQ